ncbi:protein FAR1-RELATED SEQUENCE 5-like [Carya illinoinensis]|uniref:protein FAR1-RELATED SEQUENCE 5-like n=1 Tax=Carya illinoinensis TaxID=32201 RepID=UPI001C7287A2|nr:protein FAR1-RELATED SEQUENCE 5-like [Carya illinoinensis]
MPFAPFVGVNHHRQSILLGVGLISSEDTETFVWLFKTWLQFMDGNAPKAIITDQDRAMKNTIAIVFPNTRHRFCLWHILKKVPKKLGSYDSYKTGMKSALMKCVYDTQCVDEFEKCWDQLLTTYNLGDNAWTNLKEFVDQFDNTLNKKIENENLVDFQSFNVTIPCISRSPIEKRFQELYTLSKFKEVQHQVNGIIDLNPKLHNSVGAIKTYMVEDEFCLEEFTKLVKHFVDFSEEYAVAKCSCGLFEMRGILCRHILAMITYALGSRENAEDARNKLYAMIELYRANQEGPSMTQIRSNVDCTANDTIVGASGEVRSPRVVRGKGRPPSLRRASRMEIDMRKAKAKTKKAPAKGKRKEKAIPERESVAIDITGAQSREIAIQSQESMEIGLEKSQLVHFGLDRSQPLQ